MAFDIFKEDNVKFGNHIFYSPNPFLEHKPQAQSLLSILVFETNYPGSFQLCLDCKTFRGFLEGGEF